MVDPLFHAPDVRLAAILKYDSQLHTGISRGGNEFISALGGDIDRLFRQNMQSTLSRGDALGCVQSGGAADRDQIQRAMIQERLEVSVRLGCVLLRKPTDSRLIMTVDRRDGNSGNRMRCPRVSCADVTAANQSDVNGPEL